MYKKSFSSKEFKYITLRTVDGAFMTGNIVPLKRVEGLCVIECIHPLDFVAVMHSLSCMHH